jgi:hypothetical protein
MLFDLAPRLVHSRQHRHLFFNERIDRPCPICGKDVAFEPRAVGVICGHCGSPLHRQPDDDTPLGPTAVLPFRLSDAEALAKFAEADERRKPGSVSPGRLRGVRRMYAPYWRFSAHVAASWTVSEYDRVDDRYANQHGGFTADYDEATPAAAFDGATAALADFTPPGIAEASAYDATDLAGVAAIPPTTPLANAWSDMRERWEEQVQKTMRRDRGESIFTPSEISESSSEYSQERGALVYVPVYAAEREGDMTGVPVLVDGYSGTIIRAKRRKTVAEIEAESLQVPDAAVGVGVLLVLGLVVLALALWVLRHLYWY